MIWVMLQLLEPRVLLALICLWELELNVIPHQHQEGRYSEQEHQMRKERLPIIACSILAEM